MLFNTFRKARLLPALAVLAAPAIAHAEAAPNTFVRDGVKYQYTSEVSNGRQVLTGKADSQPFRLIVSGNHVSGQFNNKPVWFSLNEVKAIPPAMAVR